MRIVGGRWRGRPLAGPDTDAIRPSSDRLRQAVFNVLAHAYDEPVRGARVLDLFAGTGAMGLEALSRGAAYVVFVDNGAEARALIRRNVEALSAGGVARLFRRDATLLGAAGPNPPFSLLFCDPPYGLELAPQALLACGAGGWLRPGALVVVEERPAAFLAPAGFAELDRRSYGAAEVTLARWQG